MILNARKKGLVFTLLGKSIEIVKEHKYLGITLSTSRLTSLYGKHIEQLLEKAEARVYAMLHLRFQKDGL